MGHSFWCIHLPFSGAIISIFFISLIPKCNQFNIFRNWFLTKSLNKIQILLKWQVYCSCFQSNKINSLFFVRLEDRYRSIQFLMIFSLVNSTNYSISQWLMEVFFKWNYYSYEEIHTLISLKFSSIPQNLNVMSCLSCK